MLLFISDLHLAEERLPQLELLRRLLQGPAKRASGLYILGDIFEQFWIGTDDPGYINQTVITWLSEFSNSTHIPLVILRGNRDFYLGEKFAEMTNCQLVEEPHSLELDKKKILLLHGDMLCTEDVSYQYYRKWVTARWTQALFFLFPLSLRKLIAHRVRAYTKQAVSAKPTIDISPATVTQMMKKYDADVLIHGHTHRPGINEFEIDHRPVRRIVLGDWYHQHGSILVYTENDFKLMSVADCIERF